MPLPNQCPLESRFPQATVFLQLEPFFLGCSSNFNQETDHTRRSPLVATFLCRVKAPNVTKNSLSLTVAVVVVVTTIIARWHWLNVVVCVCFDRDGHQRAPKTSAIIPCVVSGFTAMMVDDQSAGTISCVKFERGETLGWVLRKRELFASVLFSVLLLVKEW